MRSSTTALVALAIVLSSAAPALSAPTPVTIGKLRPLGPDLQSTPSTTGSSPVPPKFFGGIGPARIIAGIKPPGTVLSLPIHPPGSPVVHPENLGVIIKTKQRRQVEELIDLVSRALEEDDESSAALGLGDLTKLKPLAKIGGSLLGIGSDIVNIFHKPTPTPAPVPAAPAPAAPGQAQRREFEARDFDELVQLLARGDIDLDESGAFGIGSLLKPLTHLIPAIFGGGSAPPPPPPPPPAAAPAPATSQPAQKRDVSDVSATISRRDIEDFMELIARAAEDDDLESGASIVSSLAKLGTKILGEGSTIDKIGKGLGHLNTITTVVDGVKQFLTPPPPPPPAVAPAPAAAPPKRDVSDIGATFSRRDLEEFMELVARAADDEDLESGASLVSSIVQGAKKLFGSAEKIGDVLDKANTVTTVISGAKQFLTPPPPPPPAPAPAAAAPPPAARSLNELD